MTEQQNPTQDDAKAARSKALREAYQAATNQLRDENKDRFNTLYSEEADKRGQKWSPRPDAKEKARLDLKRILDENPELRQEIAAPTE